MGSVNIAVIGGSGLYNLDSIEIVDQYDIETPFGKPSVPIIQAQVRNTENKVEGNFYFLSRHGDGHTIAPSEINFRANIFALKKLGAKYIISFSAVGSLKEELSPGMFVLPDQFIDWTKGLRKRTFFSDGIVGHVSTAKPVEQALLNSVAKTCGKVGVPYSKGGTYLCIEGPQFSSKAESAIYRSFGASVIGMTNVPEAYLAKEAGMAYTTITMVTDYDCWKENHCSVEEILEVMDKNNKTAINVIRQLISYLVDNPIPFNPENKSAIITSEDKLTQYHKEILEVLMA